MAQQAASFDALEQAVQKQDAEEKSAKLFTQARARMVMGNDPQTVFFAALALKMKQEPSWTIDTAATDGKRLLYNPKWFAENSLSEAKGVIAHEVLHVAMKHHLRRGHRDSAAWNIACDLAINPLLLDAGLTLREGALLPGKGQYDNIPKTSLAAEAIYELLKKPKGEEQPDGDGEGEGEGDGHGDDPGDMGGVCEPGDGSEAAKAQAEAEANVNLAQAEQLAKKRGELPAGLDRLVNDAIRPKVDWKEVLREFVSKKCKSEYRWTPSNRHFIHQDLYLPSRSGETLGDITIAVDCSGSIDQDDLDVFGACLQGIIDAYPVNLRIVYHEDHISHVQTWEPSDGPLHLEAKGGGGTSHVCVFADIDDQPDPPTCVICLTDLYTMFPARGPEYPVLWCVRNGPADPKAPFGQTLVIDF